MASVMFTPRDVIKERMQVQHLQTASNLSYNNSMDAIKYVWKNEGLKGMFRGYFQTLTLWSLYGGVRPSSHCVNFRRILFGGLPGDEGDSPKETSL